jgi:PAS domain S-box-containing protein
MEDDTFNVSNFEILEFIPLGVFILRKDFSVVFWNSLLEEWTGIKREKVIGTSIFEHFPNLRHPKYIHRLESIFSGGPPIIFSSQLHKNLILSPLSSGRLRIQHSTVIAVQSAEEGFQALFTIQDVTDMTHRIHDSRRLHNQALQEIEERKKAEKALLQEKERLAVTLRSIGDGVITTDTGGRVVLMNNVAENLTGWSQEDACGQLLPDVYHIINKNSRLRCENPADKILAAGGVVYLDKDTILLAKDGRERIIADSGAAIRDKEGSVLGVILVFQDITEKQALEEEVLKYQKIESVGVLAGGIAHDFNNLLTAILGNISLAMALAPPEDKIIARLAEAERASLRAKDLTQQLLIFAKGGAPIKKNLNLAELLKATAAFALSGSNVSCEFAFPDDLWTVEADEGQLRQALNNLIINADQATPEGGIIKISLENCIISSEDMPPLRSGRYCKISLRDQGEGIPQQHVQRIFEPYFTTKEKGKGLGLFASYSILKKHDGHISVETTEGKGTTFTIFLPASDTNVGKQTKENADNQEGSVRILMLDDDEVIRKVAGDILKHLGYRVEFAKDGVEAIKLFESARENTRPFAAVILDLTIPGGMGGKETLAEMLKIDPSVKAVVSSGYANNPIMADYRAHGFSACISKPYTVNELSNVLKNIVH